MLYEAFSKKCDWLANALIEKTEGRMPNKKELHCFLKIKFEPQTNTNHVFWKDKLIFRSCFAAKEPEEGVLVFQGFFEVPQQLDDEFIKEYLNTW